jgi:hypothetical protein
MFPHQFDAYEPVDLSGRCINARLATGECHFPRKDTVWWTRQDLTQTPSDIYLQELTTGKFITTTQGNDTPVLAPLTYSPGQRFQKQVLVKHTVVHKNRCLITSGETVAMSTCEPNHLKRWYWISTTNMPGGSNEITLMNGAGQCLNDELKLQGCAQPRADRLTWLMLSAQLYTIRLQNKKTGQFLDVGQDGTVSLKPLGGDSQFFSYGLDLP